MKKTYVVRSKDGEYWCGLGKWDKQLRKAQVFTSTQFAGEVVYRFKELNPTIVEVRMEIVPETLTNGDRVRCMTDEELARFIFRCMHINNKALCEEQFEDWLQQPAEEVKNNA